MAAVHAERLRTIPLFAGLEEHALDSVASIASELEVPAGQVLIRAYDPGLGMFVVEEGRVVVEAHDREIELGPGEFFGELALLVPEGIRVARVRAETDVRCLAIRRDDFERLLESEPRIAVAMLPVLARRLADEMRAR
ncbi:MAG TPA: cyclic nucleotide-binding domain-containing protein [Gaiellaceae bacterium]|nr:cyclic nucleotide-binding domain-containing protein [Gaiellaceae bacterium]